jgi:hypothetical protein
MNVIVAGESYKFINLRITLKKQLIESTPVV